ncbi:hypothetical protein POVCU1_009240 [Plasmodium ovale curtisi]|uniref:Uncharacterized protein n=1 Tax=Plasmodium ovale curtisi TaxID=864141 RepID=A0A1A8VTA8_PLAOA|nr:hypothetical protein POVCU1_009240 [Plasmodium ovale curtisi]
MEEKKLSHKRRLEITWVIIILSDLYSNEEERREEDRRGDVYNNISPCAKLGTSKGRGKERAVTIIEWIITVDGDRQGKR